jgi:hypothetical protein
VFGIFSNNLKRLAAGIWGKMFRERATFQRLAGIPAGHHSNGLAISAMMTGSAGSKPNPAIEKFRPLRR